MVTLKEIAQLIDGDLEGDPSMVIFGPAKIEEGKPNTITFLANPKYTSYIYTTEASAVIVDHSFVPEREVKASLIKVHDVYLALATLMNKFDQNKEFDAKISPNSQVSPSAVIGLKVGIGAFAILADNSIIKDNSQIGAQVFIGKNVQIGLNCKIYPGVKIYSDTIIGNNVIIHANTVIGSDGFGFAKNEAGQYVKIPQIGRVLIEDDVEIGANTVIDRGSLGDTIIKKGVKLDNLIQVAHNVKIEENTAIAAQTGIAGSTIIGKSCLIGGQVGIAGHIHIGDGTIVQAKSGLNSSTQPNEKLYGYPALGYSQYLKSYAYFKKLPEMADELRQLKIELQKLKSNE
jgi:UDP-3-O-[3-hydroxymyristoyl] glucosamine N-acyltransferase